MKFIYKDLLNLLSEKPSIELLSERLFQLGHEHEINNDIFEMELTPNRGDCLSLLGLARDLNVFFGEIKEFKIFDEDIADLDIDFENQSHKDCPKISFLEIEIDGNISDYKTYIENYFSILGNNKTNFFTDVSNYVSYELGQPTHCFDATKINNKLIFENRVCDDTFQTLLDSEINLKDKNCIFSIDGEIISLAGIMGGISTACSLKTNKALVECAYFNPEAIIGKSLKYNLLSDAAHKFERGVDIENQERVLRRFIQIVRDHAVIKDIKIKTFTELEIKRASIPISVDRINKILGTKLDEKIYLTILKKLGFEIGDRVIVPSHRHDISSQNDLAEEIARVIGYDNIQSKSLKIINEGINNKNINCANKIKDFLIQHGFTEVINFPFTSSKDPESIEIDNPLDSNKRYLRTTLKDSLINNLLFNERRQKDSIKLFEISNLYSKNDQMIQETKVGIIISGRRGHNYEDFSAKLDYEYLSQLFGKDSIDIISAIEEVPRESLKTKKKEKIFYIETSVENLSAAISNEVRPGLDRINFIKYKPVSEFPSSIKDFSFSIKDIKNYDSVIRHIYELDDTNLVNAYIFDFYKNKKLGEIKVGVRFIFQSNSHTLSDDEIQKSINKLLKPIIKIEGVSIPGL